MRPVSSRWDVSASHKIVSRATLIDGDTETVLSGVVEGSVTLDAGAATRGRCDVTIVDDGTIDLVPDSASDPFAPYGNEIRLERGLRYPDGDEEYISLGIFRIDESVASDSGDGVQVRVSGLDRSARIIDARFEEAYTIPAGTSYTAAILSLLQAAYPGAYYDFASSSLTTPSLFGETGGDRWALAQSMATSMGMELYFAGDGACVLRPIPSAVAGQPVAELVDGDGGILVSADNRWTRQGAYNRVIATGENTGEGVAPVRGVATDDNPLSPTYYYGPFGRVPAFYVSEFLTTNAQAADAAAGELARQLGTSRQISFGSVVNPALEPSDVISVRRSSLDIDEEHVIDTLTIPLGADAAMSGTTRAVQVIS